MATSSLRMTSISQISSGSGKTLLPALASSMHTRHEGITALDSTTAFVRLSPVLGNSSVEKPLLRSGAPFSSFLHLGCRLVAGGKRKQGNIPRLLDRTRQSALVRRAYARQPARHYLPALGHKLLQQTNIPVRDRVNLLRAELAHLLAPEKLVPSTRSRWAATTARSTARARRMRCWCCRCARLRRLAYCLF